MSNLFINLFKVSIPVGNSCNWEPLFFSDKVESIKINFIKPLSKKLLAKFVLLFYIEVKILYDN